MPLRITIHEITEPTTVAHGNQLETVLDTASDQAPAKNMLSVVILEAENRNSIGMVIGVGRPSWVSSTDIWTHRTMPAGVNLMWMSLS